MNAIRRSVLEALYAEREAADAQVASAVACFEATVLRKNAQITTHCENPGSKTADGNVTDEVFAQNFDHGQEADCIQGTNSSSNTCAAAVAKQSSMNYALGICDNIFCEVCGHDNNSSTLAIATTTTDTPLVSDEIHSSDKCPSLVSYTVHAGDSNNDSLVNDAVHSSHEVYPLVTDAVHARCNGSFSKNSLAPVMKVGSAGLDVSGDYLDYGESYASDVETALPAAESDGESCCSDSEWDPLCPVSDDPVGAVLAAAKEARELLEDTDHFEYGRDLLVCMTETQSVNFTHGKTQSVTSTPANPAMPCKLGSEPKQKHRPRMSKRNYGLPLAVAKNITRKEWQADPTGEAAKAVDKEWTALERAGVWSKSSVRCWYQLAREAREAGKKLHLGALFDLCVLKGSELPPGAKGRKHKGRVVFQGNRVSDEQRNHALFQDLGSAPSSMESARFADFVGCTENCEEELSDAEMAYIQSPFAPDAIETWVALPEERWPAEWHQAVRDGTMARPVVKLEKALYGHPDAGSMWEKHADAHLKSQGFEALQEYGWQSCYIHQDLKLFLVVYVDDFKFAGLKDNLAEGWRRIRLGLKLDDPININGQMFLGCKHQKSQQRLPDGRSISVMSYDMEDFFKSCCDSYLELAAKEGYNKPLSKKAPTPFLQDDPLDFVQAIPASSSTGPVFECAWCRHTCPAEEVEAALQELKKAAAQPSKAAKAAKTKEQAGEAIDMGELKPIVVRILMKLLFGARMCRFDLLTAICKLARRVTKWDSRCDAALHRLVSYVSQTLHLRLTGWTGDSLSTVQPFLYADADLGGCTQTSRSIAGIYCVIRGPLTCFPIAASSKVHANLSSSTPEAELVSGSMALRTIGIAALDLCDILLHLPTSSSVRTEPVVMTMEENSTAFISVVKKGRNPTMRYLRRHHRLSIGMLHETFSREDWRLRHCESGRMAADIFTKSFSCLQQWNALLDLINHFDPTALVKFFQNDEAGSHLDKVYQPVSKKALGNKHDEDNPEPLQLDHGHGSTCPSKVAEQDADGNLQLDHGFLPRATTTTFETTRPDSKNPGKSDADYRFPMVKLLIIMVVASIPTVSALLIPVVNNQNLVVLRLYRSFAPQTL